MQKRREMQQDGSLNHMKYLEVCKTVRKKIRVNCRQLQIKEITEWIKDKKSLKKAKIQLSLKERKSAVSLADPVNQ